MNREGAPEKIQTVYQKNNLKKKLEDFSEELHCTMGCQVIMLVSHKKKTDKSLAITLSDSIKEWSSTGFKLFAEWSKTKFYHTDKDQDDLGIDDSDKAGGVPELVFDQESYEKLPSHDGVALKGQ
ncbi:hypothetical protein BDR04DRAFT_1163807 [Suillus decipiens]|nr:hypothetical protein BDR04DRAFT_1163807 [Suillus decipiens]